MRIVALDIGGANVKCAAHGGRAFTLPFELWRRPGDLAGLLEQALLDGVGPIDVLAVTMTGELCDCFETKAEGVLRILQSVRKACATQPTRTEVLVWRTDARFVTVEDALADPLPVAAANWLALAHLAGEYAPEGRALLVDVGSTTTDVVPLLDGFPLPAGRTDTQRLLTRELVYTGVSRTPVCALVADLPYRGERCPVSAELFATTLDVHLILGNIAESQSTMHTADAREATKSRARERLARMVCADPGLFTAEEALTAARSVAEAQETLLGSALDDVAGRLGWPISAAVVSGSGEFLAVRLTRRVAAKTIRLSEILGPEASTAAPAVALAKLAAQWKQSSP